MRVSEIRVKRIPVNQGLGVFSNKAKLFQEATVAALSGPGHSCQVVQLNSCTISSSKRDLILDN